MGELMLPVMSLPATAAASVMTAEPQPRATWLRAAASAMTVALRPRATRLLAVASWIMELPHRATAPLAASPVVVMAPRRAIAQVIPMEAPLRRRRPLILPGVSPGAVDRG